MGQKVNPTSLRLKGNWLSNWCTAVDSRDYAYWAHQDYLIRDYIESVLKSAGRKEGKSIRYYVGNIRITRIKYNVQIMIYYIKVDSARRRNRGKSTNFFDSKYKYKEQMENTLSKITKCKVAIVPITPTQPEAKIIAKVVASMFEQRQRIGWIKKYITNIYKSKDPTSGKPMLNGIKAKFSGRINGVDIAQTHTVQEGSVPLQSFNVKIDYSLVEAFTTYGVIGVKIWLHKTDSSDEYPFFY